jgi:TPP-dependent pyruvate/acetoin dehydrogenase alpha subunit
MESRDRLKLYMTMYSIRKAEEQIVEHYLEDEMKTPMHMSMGQEAVATAVCQALGSDGQVFGFYRSHAVFLAKTGDPDRFFGELYGKTAGTAHGKSGSMHLAAPDCGLMCTSAVVGTTIPLAVGAAFANKQHGNGRIACAYFGDGALEEGVFWESLNAACVMQLPILFVCEDNGLAVHSKREVRQGFKSISDVVENFECNIFHEDSTQVEVLYSLVLEAISAIRTTGKPSFVHIDCYRYLGHIGITEDFDAGYRTRTEGEDWLARDPLVLQRQRLLNDGWTDESVAKEENRVERLMYAALRKAQMAPFPSSAELYIGVFNEAH